MMFPLLWWLLGIVIIPFSPLFDLLDLSQPKEDRVRMLQAYFESFDIYDEEI